MVLLGDLRRLRPRKKERATRNDGLARLRAPKASI